MEQIAVRSMNEENKYYTRSYIYHKNNDNTPDEYRVKVHNGNTVIITKIR